MFLERIKIRTKIISVIVLMAILSLAGLIYLSVKFNDANERYNAFITRESMAAMLNARSTGNLLQMGLQLSLAALNDPSSAEFKAALAKYDADRAQIKERLLTTAKLVPSRAEPVEAMLQGVAKIEDIGATVLSLAQSGQRDQAQHLMKTAGSDIMGLLPLFASGNDQLIKAMESGRDEITATVNRTIFTSLSGLGIAIALMVLLGLYVSSRGITRPIERLRGRMLSLAGGNATDEIAGLNRGDEIGQMATAVATFRDNARERVRLEQEAEANRSLTERERIERDELRAKEAADIRFAVDGLAAGLVHLAEGNVTYRIATPFVAHLDGLRDNFNTSVEKLQETLEAVGENARGIDSGANEIRSAADDLAKRTEQQAASVEETAAALEQITTTVKDSTRRAEEAGALVGHARTQAGKSGDVVKRAVSAMHEIEKSSQEISNIIGVIDEIAFQTNLLALNAGVEAARAGDAGKGFAVVAQEVRELAQRSANAAKEIKALISTSGNQVRSGVELVEETGTSLQEIVEQVQQINRHVTAIVEAAREQSVGLQEINTAVNTMDQGTQQNAAMVEQSTAASHSLAREAQALNRLLAQFTLSRTSGRSAPMPSSSHSQPVASPARALGRKLAGAFANNRATSAAVAQDASWEEF
jgi:methyl-accepting chemotaxis protein